MTVFTEPRTTYSLLHALGMKAFHMNNNTKSTRLNSLGIVLNSVNMLLPKCVIMSDIGSVFSNEVCNKINKDFGSCLLVPDSSVNQESKGFIHHVLHHLLKPYCRNLNADVSSFTERLTKHAAC